MLVALNYNSKKYILYYKLKYMKFILEADVSENL